MKTYRNLFVGLFVLIAACMSCNQGNKPEIGISMGPIHERWIKDKDFLTDHLESRGAKVYARMAEGSQETQNEQIKLLINKKPDVLIIVPVNSKKCGAVANLARNKGIKVIAYDRIIKNCNLDFYLSFDNVKVGELQAEYITRIKPTGEYAVLGGSPTDNNSSLIKLGQMNILQPLITKGDIDIVLDRFVMDWSPERSFEIVDQYLNEHEPMDAIIAASDAVADGAAKALKKHKLGGKVLLTGQDATVKACKRIVEGTQTMTVYKSIESLAYSTAKIAIDLAKGVDIPNTYTTTNNGKVMVPSILLSSVVPVNKENIRMTVIADGYLDENAIFEK